MTGLKLLRSRSCVSPRFPLLTASSVSPGRVCRPCISPEGPRAAFVARPSAGENPLSSWPEDVLMAPSLYRTVALDTGFSGNSVLSQDFACVGSLLLASRLPGEGLPSVSEDTLSLTSRSSLAAFEILWFGL